MPQERLFKQALLAKANGKSPVGRPRTSLMDVLEDREVWRLNLELLSPQPSRKSGQ